MDRLRPTLLLLPGLEGSGDLFAGFLEALGEACDARIVRYPSSCRTYADAARVVRDALPDTRPLVILAESFSTPIAIEFAAQLQDSLDGLVLCNGFAASPVSAMQSTVALAWMPWVLYLPLTELSARTFLIGPEAPDELLAAVQKAVVPVTAGVLAGRLKAVLQCDAREALRRVTTPMLYLQATHDRLIGEAGLREILRIRPQLRVERVIGPHLLLQREPIRSAEIVRQFLQGIAATGRQG